MHFLQGVQDVWQTEVLLFSSIWFDEYTLPGIARAKNTNKGGKDHRARDRTTRSEVKARSTFVEQRELREL